MSNHKSLKERLNSINDRGPDKWLSRTLFEYPTPNADNQARDDAERMRPDPEIEKELGQGPARIPARGFNPFGKRPEPQPEKVKRNIGDLANQTHFQNGFAKRNSKLNWQTEDNPKAIQDWGIHALMDARDFAEDQRIQDIVSPSGPNMDLPQFRPAEDRRRLNYEEVQALDRRRDRNKALYGSHSEEDLKSLDPDIKDSILKRTSQLVQSSRPFHFSTEFIEKTFQLLKNAIDDTAFKPSGGRTGDPSKKAGGEKAGYAGIKPGDTRGAAKFMSQEEGEFFPTFHAPKFTDSDYKTDSKGNKVLKAAQQRKLDAYKKHINAVAEETIGQLIRDGGTGLPRAKMAWQLYLAQGGLDALTGLELDPRTMQLDHVAPFDSNLATRSLPPSEMMRLMGELGIDDPGDRTLQMAMADRRLELIKQAQEKTDNYDNLVLLNSSTNAAKLDYGIEEMYSRQVDPFVGLERDQFGGPEDGLETMQNLAGTYDRNKKKILGDEGFLNRMAGFFVDVDGNFVGDSDDPEMRGTLKQFMSELELVQEKMQKIRNEVVGKDRNKTEFARARGLVKPKALKKGPKHNTPEKKAEYEKALAAYNNGMSAYDDAQAKKNAKMFNNQAPNIMTRLRKDILKMTNHNAGFRWQTGGDTWKESDFQRYFDKMANDKNITENNNEYRRMWNHMANRAQKLTEYAERLTNTQQDSSHLMNPSDYFSFLLSQADVDPTKYDFGDDDETFSGASIR